MLDFPKWLFNDILILFEQGRILYSENCLFGEVPMPLVTEITRSRYSTILLL